MQKTVLPTPVSLALAPPLLSFLPFLPFFSPTFLPFLNLKKMSK